MSDLSVTSAAFNQELFVNKCSSYIDNNRQFRVADMILNQNNNVDSSMRPLNSINKTLLAPKSATKNTGIKKIKKAISNKIKKLIALNTTPDELDLTETNFNQTVVANRNQIQGLMSSSKRKSLTKSIDRANKTSAIQLVNFAYKSNFMNLEESRVEKTPRINQHRYNMNRMESVSCLNPRVRRNSAGHMSSSSSGSSLDSNNFLFANDTPSVAKSVYYDCCSVARQQNGIECSTPLCHTASKCISYEFEQSICEEEIDQVNVAYLLDQSTQAPIDAPVLVESTFNTSSLSNLSDDLIILQTAKPAPKFNMTPLTNSTRINNSDMVNKKRKCSPFGSIKSKLARQDETHSFAVLNQTPDWANGYQLNMALVNQLYFNPSARGVFNNSSVLSSRPSLLI